jgi:exonuclease SbcC
MKIAKLRFKNINSLAGEWEIDFTHPMFADAGLFAITGPTGAGKTSILDAVCLAMYGKTPRVNVTAVTNEVMSRHTGECFSEVTFEVKNEKYVAWWGQQRARKKSDGNLQSPKREIRQLVDGEYTILAEKIMDSDAKIKEITGMEFEQFTRTILLAQGSFAAFLQANDAEKGEILEQITGTEIYGEISIKVHERKKAEQDILNVIAAELGAIRLLNHEEKEQLLANVRQKEEEKKASEEKISANQQKINWLKSISDLKTQLAANEEAMKQLHESKTAFAPEKSKLERALRAATLDGDFAGIQASRKELQAEQEKLAKEQALLPEYEQTVEAAKQKEETAGEQLEKAKKERETLTPKLIQVREWDVRKKEKEEAMRPIVEAVKQQENSAKELNTKREQQEKELQVKHNQYLIKQEWTKQNKQYQSLIEKLAAIETRCEQAKNAYSQYDKQNNDYIKAGLDLKTKTAVCTTASDKHEKQAKALIDKEKELKTNQEKLSEILNNKELSKYRTEKENWQQRETNLLESKKAVAEILENQRTIIDLKGKITKYDSEITTLAAQLKGYNEDTIPAVKEQIKLLEENRALVETIKSLEDHRKHLTDGQPCPLCGATEHPYAKGNSPVMDDKKQQLAQLQDKLDGLTQAIQECTSKKVSSETSRNHTEKQIQEKNVSLAKAQALFGEISEKLPELHGITIDENTENRLNGLLNTTGEEYKQIKNRIESAEEYENSIKQLQEMVIPELRRHADTSHKVMTEADTAKKLAEQNIQTLEQNRSKLKAYYTQSLEMVVADFAVYGMENITMDTLDNHIRQLKEYRNQWQGNEAAIERLDKEITELKNQKTLTEKSIETNIETLSEKNAELQSLHTEKENIHNQRIELFGNKNPDEEEQRADKAVKDAEQAKNTVVEAHNKAITQLATSKKQINEWLESIVNRKTAITELEGIFRTQLQQKEFADEQAYLSASLPESERTALMQKADELQAKELSLSGRKKQTEEQLQTETDRNLTDEMMDNLKMTAEELTGKKDELIKSIGADTQMLEQNTKNEQQHGEKIKEKEWQEQQYIRWKNLDDLIGSGDGKKYRNFAQGLTFDYMIRHANRQLQKMFDRYILQRDRNKPLELCVIDNYQGGELRSVKNLSGGESFVVSLALALGLSYMASKNVQINSLFLDEGFGTLDEESLDMALTTLSGLQQEGKLIGVISHVQALKDRIGTQIQIIPEGNGKSRMEGAGCSKKQPKYTEISFQAL